MKGILQRSPSDLAENLLRDPAHSSGEQAGRAQHRWQICHCCCCWLNWPSSGHFRIAIARSNWRSRPLMTSASVCIRRMSGMMPFHSVVGRFSYFFLATQCASFVYVGFRKHKNLHHQKSNPEVPSLTVPPRIGHNAGKNYQESKGESRDEKSR